MRLFKLTFGTIFQRKAWAICALAVVVLPFVMPLLSTATEKPILIQPARIQAAWGILWICTIFWGLFTAAREGETNAKTGVGEYFLTTGVSSTRQLMEIWLAVFAFVAPLAVMAAAVCQFGASPSDPVEQAMWWTLNVQYLSLFLLVVSPLLALSTALASRFGAIAGFAVTVGITLYGLYGVGYLKLMLQQDTSPLMRGLWLISPHYNLADLTQRLFFKAGALPTSYFLSTLIYFGGIFAVYVGISRLCFKSRLSA